MDPWIPSGLPPRDINYGALFHLSNSATAALAKFDGIMGSIRQPGLLLVPLLTEEAVLSSRIEGTQATVEDVFEAQAGTENPGLRLDLEEVTNCVKAISLTMQAVKEQPVTLGLVKEAHKVLMTGVRGQSKNPGKFRTKQNFIARDGATIDEATFVPPSSVGLDAHMQEWQDYLRRDDEDPVVQTAVMHAYFECLHPFEDGNGRLGRLLIPFQLCRRGTMSNATFFMSGYLERNRPEYYERLGRVSQLNDWTGWIDFFMRAVHAQAAENVVRGEGINELYRRTHDQVPKIVASSHAAPLVEFLFTAPIFSIANIVSATTIPAPTAQGLIRALVADGMVKVHQAGSGRRATVYVFTELFKALGHKSAHD